MKEAFKEISLVVNRDDKGGITTHDAPGYRFLDTGTISKIRDLQHRAVMERYAEEGIVPLPFKTVRDEEARMATRVLDSYFNPITGAGTNLDPGTYNQASIPFTLTPNEATSIYASGGLPQKIVDKKVKGVLMNGFDFKSRTWKEKSLKELKEYAQKVCLDIALENVIRDGCIYGGSILVPAFKGDGPISYEMDFDELVSSGILKKDSLDYFWTADRWNAVLVPQYDIAAKDYITPPQFYVPLAGLTVKTDRLAIIRPKILPYWGTLRQMGWGISELEGWMRAVSAYEILISTIPIMAQQMSLIYHHIPMDGLIAQNGPEYAQQFALANSNSLKQWNMLNPKTINSIGEIKSIDRSFSDFDKLVGALQEKISADSGLPQSTLFNRQSTGFSNNSDDVTLKQAEEIQTLARTVANQLDNITKILVFSCFGPDSPEAKAFDEVKISFENPVVLSDEARSNMGVKFANIYAQIWNTGVDAETAFKLAKVFISGIDFPDELTKKLKDVLPEPGELEGDPYGGNQKKPVKEAEHERAFGPKQALSGATGK